MKRLDIIGVQLDLGASKKGVNMGPSAIRFAGLCDMLKKEGFDYVDEGDLLPILGGRTLPNMHYYEAINGVNKQLFREVTDSLKRDRLPIVLGGDHSIAAGSASAVSSFYGDIGIIWLDAHADFNDDESTVTGNVHGMPLSALCGWGPDSMLDFGVPVTLVNPKHVAIVGARCIDDAEWPRLKEAGVSVFTMDDINRDGFANVMSKAIDIASSGTKGIHLSYDVDGVDPVVAPGVGTPVNNGLSLENAFEAVRMIKESAKMLAMDMVEVNPILDKDGKTAKLACELILAALK